MAIFNKLKAFPIILLFAACSVDTKTQIDSALNSDDYVIWEKDKLITLDLFQPEENSGSINAYIGTYFIYDFREMPKNFKFNITVFLDKKKSFVDLNTDISKEESDLFLTKFKLKFDHFELYARKTRKYFIENRDDLNTLPEEEMNSRMGQFFTDAEKSWDKIEDNIKTDFTYDHLKEIRYALNIDLESYKDFGPQVNNYN